jgi:hypothetical protein
MDILAAHDPGQRAVARRRGLVVAEEIISPMFEIFIRFREGSPWRAVCTSTKYLVLMKLTIALGAGW